MKNFKVMGFGLIAVFIWSAIPAFVKLGASEASLSFLLVCRFLVASFIFAPRLVQIAKKANLVRKTYWMALAFILGANYYFQGLAMIEMPVSWYLIIFCLNPVLSLFFIGLKFNRKTNIALALSVVGTLLFIDRNEIMRMHSYAPFIFITIGMLTWVAYTVLIRKFQADFTNVETTALTQYLSLIASLGIWFSTGMPLIKLGGSEMLAIVTLGITTPIAYFGFNSCLRQLPRFSIVSQYLEPVFGVLIGLVFFHESFSTLQLLGAGFIVLGTAALE